MKYLLPLLLTMTAHADDIKLHIVQAALVNNVSSQLLSAVCYVETTHRNVNNWQDGDSPSYGPCQIKLDTAKMLGFKGPIFKLFEPAVSIHYAAKYLAKQLDNNEQNWVLAVAAYNAGTVKYNRRGELVNKDYVSKVFTAIAEEK